MNARKNEEGVVLRTVGAPYRRLVPSSEAHPQASVSTENLTHIAQVAERGLMDFVFIADTNNVWEENIFFSKRIMQA
ncbi:MULTISPECIES: hypothetical protein [Nguyenibacter]|uniref:Uncharacterized protein n=1 Tax=Nguyenibacter vanlangensis TaxID=1216886 RepID=A0A7Y7ISN0_9PROT|nr:MULTISPECIES: hypothetical protein [Nguyenibacter]NVN09591.1 hypothetical protein [Nguyenibacter vanlangensis]WRH89162.1 hypothetical protein QN315_05915 [Nguyenibacter sp. L1]